MYLNLVFGSKYFFVCWIYFGYFARFTTTCILVLVTHQGSHPSIILRSNYRQHDMPKTLKSCEISMWEFIPGTLCFGEKTLYWLVLAPTGLHLCFFLPDTLISLYAHGVP